MSRYLSNFSRSFNVIYKKLGSIPFVFILIAIAIYFWINGPAHFANWGSNQSNVIMIYIVMMAGFLVWSKSRNKEMYTPISSSAFIFVSFFLITWVILLGLAYAGLIAPATDFNIDMFWPMVIMHICVVAPAEELIFRGVFIDMFTIKKHIYFAIIGQAILFAIWHSYAYNILWYDLDSNLMNLGPLVFAFCMAILLGFIAVNKKFGLPATIAIHACYNLVILGAFIPVILQNIL